MSDSSQEAADIIRKLWKTRQVYNTLGAGPLVYLAVLIMGLTKDEAMTVLIYFVPPVSLVFSLAAPYLTMRWMVRRAFETIPGEPPEARLARLLKVPSNVTLLIFAVIVPGVSCIIGAPVLLFGRSPWILLWGIVTLGLQILLLMIPEQIRNEQSIRPYAIAEFHRLRGILPQGKGFSWPRQSWFLPYAFGIFVACTLATTLTVVGRQGYDTFSYLMTQGTGGPSGTIETSLLGAALSKLAKDSLAPVIVLGGYLLFVAALAAWQMARRLKEGAESVQVALEGLAQGNPQMPQWVSTDEIGDLAASTTRVLEQLRSFSLSLRDSAVSLQQSAQQLGQSTVRQSEVLAVQASALQETQVTTEEIKNTSRLASQTAGNILKQAERAQDISQAGEQSLQEGLQGIAEIGVQVREMAMSIKSLDERARQIARITSMVKDLADQSNMLALNAAIEAVRSGESGKGFGVVAMEIRSLADQSIRATHSIRTILQDIGSAIGTAASLTQKGSQRVEASLTQIRSFSEQVQQLAAISRDNANSVRQIATAVTQQDAGIVQINQAVAEMTRIMDQTMSQIRASEEALGVVRNVATQVTGFVGQYGWSQDAATITKPPV